MFRLRVALASRLRLHLVQVMSRKQLDNFVRLLKASPSGSVFNPWWQIDEENDFGPHSPAIRRKHLAVYFRERLGKALLEIIGEALGYPGGHFIGIPITSERVLAGKQPVIFAGLNTHRPSKTTTSASAVSEPPRTI